MPRTRQGANLHSTMIENAIKKFEARGYTVIREARLGKNRIDALAIRGKDKIGIDCQLTISFKLLEEKFNNYGRELTKMIFIVPKYREDKMKNVIDFLVKRNRLSKNFFEVWSVKMERPMIIRLSKSTVKKLSEIRKPRQAYEEVILELLNRRKGKR